MPELLEPKARQAEEAVKDLPGAVDEAVSLTPGRQRSETDASAPAATPRQRLRSSEVVEAAYEVAKEIYGCWEFAERLKVYGSLKDRFSVDARRVLDAAATRWPELIYWVNDLPEWKALLSADLS